MGSLAELYIKKETLKTLLDVVTKKEERGISLTLSINDDSNDYGQNISSYVTQTKEQREAKKDKFYVGNGKVFWTDGKINKAVKKEEQSIYTKTSIAEDDDDLPF